MPRRGRQLSRYGALVRLTQTVDLVGACANSIALGDVLQILRHVRNPANRVTLLLDSRSASRQREAHYAGAWELSQGYSTYLDASDR